MLDYEKIINLIKIKGPIVPVQLSKEIGQNILFTSAILSELVSKGRLKVSNLKIGGGSPLYYQPGQEAQLTRFVSNLNEKDKKTYLLLREHGILRDRELDALTRFSLRIIKDFAAPLQVTLNECSEIFWRYFLLSSEEAEERIRRILGVQEHPKKEKAEPQESSVDSDVKSCESAIHQAEGPQSSVSRLEPAPASQASEQPAEEVEHIVKKEVQKELVKPQRIHKKVSSKGLDSFYVKVIDFFEKNKIKVLNEEIIKKGDYHFMLEVNSVVGIMAYFCVAKNKRRINEGDISILSIKARAKNLPPLLLTPGSPTRSARMLLEKELKGLNIKQI